jgi:glycyl-tRNA synthetase beta chain
VRDAIARAEALSAVRGSEDFIAISAAFKRITNILRQSADRSTNAIAADRLADPAERALYENMMRVITLIEPARASRRYAEALEQIATLRPHVDLFFDKVMVMAEDEQVRANRLALITKVKTSFSSIADFSEIVTA